MSVARYMVSHFSLASANHERLSLMCMRLGSCQPRLMHIFEPITMTIITTPHIRYQYRIKDYISQVLSGGWWCWAMTAEHLQHLPLLAVLQVLGLVVPHVSDQATGYTTVCSDANITQQQNSLTAIMPQQLTAQLVSLHIHCGAKKLHRFIFAISSSNQAIF